MILERFILGPVETNTYLVGCEATREGAVIDPADDAPRIARQARSLGLDVLWILNTHGHGDHIAANEGLRREFPKARIAIHPADAPCLEDPDLNLTALFGIPLTSPPADLLLKDGDEITVGRMRFTVIHVPGHTAGGIAFFAPPSESVGVKPVLFSGDALFAGSVGRSDFPGGSHEQLIAAIRTKLLSLPPDTVVYPGHGAPTTIGDEAQDNPFLGAT